MAGAKTQRVLCAEGSSMDYLMHHYLVCTCVLSDRLKLFVSFFYHIVLIYKIILFHMTSITFILCTSNLH